MKDVEQKTHLGRFKLQTKPYNPFFSRNLGFYHQMASSITMNEAWLIKRWIDLTAKPGTPFVAGQMDRATHQQ